MDWEEQYDEELRLRRVRRGEQDYAYRAQWRDGMPAMPPQSITGEDDLSRLDEIGGPAEIAALADTDLHFDRCCSVYWEREVLSVIMPYSPSLMPGRRHWPWVARGLDRYRIRNDHGDQAADLSPKLIETILGQIRSDAERLQRNLNAIESACHTFRDHSEIMKEGHLNYIDGLLAQAVAAVPSTQLDESSRWSHLKEYREWRFELFKLIDGAKYCQSIFSKDLVAAQERVMVPGIRDFVAGLAVIWTSLTGRTPSVERRHSLVEQEEPDFVLFVQAIAGLDASVPTPKFSQIQNIMKPRNKRRNRSA